MITERFEMTEEYKEMLRLKEENDIKQREKDRKIPISPMLALDYEKTRDLFKKVVSEKSSTKYNRDNRRFFISKKIDGIRCITKYGNAFSRSGKDMKNKYIKKMLEEMPNNYIFDGELTTGEIKLGVTFANLTNGIMKIAGEPNFTYHIFDLVIDGLTHQERYNILLSMKDILPSYCKIVEKTIVETEEDMKRIASEYLQEGYEGAMLNDISAEYKYGRATMTKPILVKYKQFIDDEAIVIGVEELEINLNESFEDELGHTKRSTSKLGKVKSGRLGSFICKTKNGIEFRCGCGRGLTFELRELFWIHRDDLIGKIIKFKHFEIGADSAPRMPVFIGFRDADDM